MSLKSSLLRALFLISGVVGLFIFFANIALGCGPGNPCFEAACTRFSKPSLQYCVGDVAILDPGNSTYANFVNLMSVVAPGVEIPLDSGEFDSWADKAWIKAEEKAAVKLDEALESLGEEPTGGGHLPGEQARSLPFGSHCISNSYQNAMAFKEALDAAFKRKSIDLADQINLLVQRAKFIDSCTALNPEDAPEPGSTPVAETELPRPKTVGEEFARYIEGISAFYSSEYPKADRVWRSLLEAKDPWLRETASYLRGRTAMLRMGDRWYDYSSARAKPEEKSLIDLAKERVLAYLASYPKGLYTESARGMLRKIAFYAGSNRDHETQLGEALERAVAAKWYGPSGYWLAILGIEASNLSEHTNPEVFQTPLLGTIAALWLADVAEGPIDDMDPYGAGLGHLTPELLAKLRKKSELKKRLADPKWITALEAAKEKYAKFPGLYDYVHGLILYSQGKYTEVLKSTAPGGENALTRGHRILLARALEKLSKWEKAREIWKGIARLAINEKTPTDPDIISVDGFSFAVPLAQNYLRAGKMREIFKKDSGVSSRKVKMDVLHALAPKSLLLDLANDHEGEVEIREEAARTYLMRSLLAHEASEFVAQWKSWRESFPKVNKEFGEIAKQAEVLAKDPKAPRALYELGRFFYGINDPWRGGLDRAFTPCPLEGTLTFEYALEHPERDSDWIPKWLAPVELYAESIRSFEAQGKGDPVEAKALSDAIYCYKQSSNAGGCLWSTLASQKSFELEQRRAWFKRLHAKYGKTDEAKSTQYYY